MRTKAIGIIFSLLLSMNAVAQTNLTPAYIVTQKGDTIHGQAEKRTEVRNSRQCVFVAEGSSAAVTYRPGEIACYRYEDDGRLYVSKEVEMFGKTERVFAEQLIRGKVSLYNLKQTGAGEVFFFENQEGKLVEYHVKDNETLEAKRQRLVPVFDILRDSQAACDELNHGNFSRRQFMKIVTLYNTEMSGMEATGKYAVVGTDVQQTFEHKNTTGQKSTVAKFHVRAGVSTAKFPVNDFYYANNFKYVFDVNAVSPTVVVGVDVSARRICKQLLFQGAIGFSHISKSFDIPVGGG